jgi:myo-inositol catabolism protein IolS
MTEQHVSFAPVQIGPSAKQHLPLGMGGSFYGLDHDQREGETEILAALATALELGITHFDTATGYGNGYSERLIGRFMAAKPGRRERIFLASNYSADEISAQGMTAAIDASRDRLQTDRIDLYYIHWPRTGQDLRPWMEALETARAQGKIQTVGVSNFSIAQMQQVAEVGRIDAHQLGYNLLWRFDEADIIPYCGEQGIAIVVYSALAHGILAGNYARQLNFVPDDQRWRITLFRDDVWPQVYAATEKFKAVAARAGRLLAELALRWLLHQPGVTSVLVSAKTPQQVRRNAPALTGPVSDSILDELTAISDRVRAHIPDESNPFGYHP